MLEDLNGQVAVVTGGVRGLGFSMAGALARLGVHVALLDMLADGVPEAEILEDYAFLQIEDIRACLEFAAEQVNYPVLVNA